MKIGDIELEVSAPDPERLLAATGQTVDAMRRLLERPLIAGIVAAALHACLKVEDEMISVHELAVQIASNGIEDVRSAVLELFGGGEEPQEQASAWPIAAQPSSDSGASAELVIEEPTHGEE